MSDNWGYDESGNMIQDPNQMNGPKALRDAYDAQKKRNDELQEQFAKLQAEVTQQRVSSVFADLGVPAAASQYRGDADPEKIKAWVNDMRSVFGATGAPAPIESSQPQVTLEGDAAAQLQRMNEAGTQGAPLGNAEAAYGRVNDAANVQDLINAWKTM